MFPYEAEGILLSLSYYSVADLLAMKVQIDGYYFCIT
jgi:hypothetical protein